MKNSGRKSSRSGEMTRRVGETKLSELCSWVCGDSRPACELFPRVGASFLHLQNQ